MWRFGAARANAMKMPMNVMAPSEPIANDEPRPFKLRIEDYELLDRAGAFQGLRVELIGGRVVVVNARFQAHGLVKNRLGRRLQSALEAMGSDLETVIEGSLALSANDLPDPDILVGAVTPVRDYIRVDQVALVIEVADTSIRHDLGEKRDLYAIGKVPEYWVVDVNTAVVHRFWEPQEGVYRAEPPIPLAGELRSLTMPELTIDGAGML
ncbi:Uma2 family endonuclease [uncultured Sphingomonas sp.]|uniref:Uma2 family endonuclease n=1 Tax=uncultured Sphingomonas sp. TaxID=158754 RepID=UPI0035CB636E